jgi:hypothetical protein
VAALTQAQVRECQALLTDILEEEEALLPQCQSEWAEREKALSLSTQPALETSAQLGVEKAAVLPDCGRRKPTVPLRIVPKAPYHPSPLAFFGWK